MRERNVGSVVLAGGDEPHGFVTDRDLAINVLADGRAATDRAADHASAPVITGTPDMDVHEAAELMVRHRVRRLPIVDGERLTGIVTMDDLAVRTGSIASDDRAEIRARLDGVGQILLVLGLWALIGLGAGILIPNQVAALLIAIGVAWIVEPIAGALLSTQSWGEGVSKYFPSSATTAVLQSYNGGNDNELTWWVGAIVLAAYAAIMAGVGSFLTVRRDIS